jgi:hypothetical protein
VILSCANPTGGSARASPSLRWSFAFACITGAPSTDCKRRKTIAGRWADLPLRSNLADRADDFSNYFWPPAFGGRWFALAATTSSRDALERPFRASGYSSTLSQGFALGFHSAARWAWRSLLRRHARGFVAGMLRLPWRSESGLRCRLRLGALGTAIVVGG